MLSLPFLLVVITTLISQVSSIEWQPLGEPGCGGDITAVRINPFNTSQIFIAGDMLGVGVSLNNGSTFSSPSADSFLSYEHSDFSFDPYLERIYVASTSGPYYANFSTPLVWASIRNGFPAVNADYGSYPAALQVVLIDPVSNGTRLLALGGSKRGWPRVMNLGVVWESTDAGASWLNITNVGPANVQSNIVAAQWSGTSCIWAAVSGVGMVRSTDSGLSWATRWPASHSTDLASCAVHPTDCDTAYAAMCNDGSILKTMDGGLTWIDASSGLPKGGCVSAFGSAGATDPLTLYAGNSNVGKSAFVSHDGGNSWSPTSSPPEQQAYGLGLQSSFLSVHPTDRDTILYGTWVTLWRSTDGGGSWKDLTANSAPGDTTGTIWRGTGYGGLVSTNIAFNPYTSQKYPFQRAFIQGMDAGKIWGAADSSSPPTFWKRQSGLNLFGGGNSLAFAADGTTIYAGTGQFDWPTSFSTEGVVLSTDGGDSWTYSCGSPLGLSGSTEASAVCVTPANASNVWAVYQDGRLYFSDTSCRNWTLVDSVNDTITGLVCPQAGTTSSLSPDPTDAEMYAAGWRGVFALGKEWGSEGLNDWKLLRGGPTAWQYSTNDCKLAPLDAPEPRLVCANAWWDQWHSGLWTLNITKARVNISVDAWTWVIQDSNIYRWTAAPGTNGRVQAYASNENPYPERCDAKGVFISTDFGVTWSRQVEGLRMRRVSALEFSPDGTYLIAGLNGGGFYVSNTTSLLASAQSWSASFIAPPPTPCLPACRCDATSYTCIGRNLSAFPADMFRGWSALETINLSGNNASSLPDGLFAGLPALTALDISGNPLRSLPGGWLAGARALVTLLLSGLPLNTTFDVARVLGGTLPALTTLVLDSPTLLGGGGACPDLSTLAALAPRLATLYARHGLTSIPARSFAGLNLSTLDLSYSSLPALTNDSFDGLQVGEVKLEWSGIAAIEARAFAGLTAGNVDLYFNQISSASLPAGGLDLPGVAALCLAGNPFDARIFAAPLFASTPRLVSLDMMGGMGLGPWLGTIPPRAFAGAPGLTTLQLFNSGITGFAPGAFEGLPRLLNLNIGGTNSGNSGFSAVPAGLLDPLPTLQTLVINNAALSGADALRADAFAHNRIKVTVKD